MERKQNYLKDLIYILIGNLIVACGVSFFVLPNNILTGGVSGVAVALEPLIHIDPVWMINGLTIGLYLLGLCCWVRLLHLNHWSLLFVILYSLL